MDRDLIAQKIESLRRCVVRVRQKCPATAGILEKDADAQDILTLNLTRTVQLYVDIGAHLYLPRRIRSRQPRHQNRHHCAQPFRMLVSLQ